MRRITPLLPAIVCALALTSCTSGGSTPTTTVTITQTQQVAPRTLKATASPEPVPTRTTTVTPAPTSTSNSQGLSTELVDANNVVNLAWPDKGEIVVNFPPGTAVRANEDLATICQYSNGLAVGIIAVGDHTSCKFAVKVAEQLNRYTSVKFLEDPTRNPDYERGDERMYLPATIRVPSPVTGQSYDMTCTVRNDIITCKGGADASVYLR